MSAPTTILPSEPTRTGTATSSATSDSVSVPSDPDSRNIGPRGLISAHAQKFTANPTVAITSIKTGERVPGRSRVSATASAPDITVLPWSHD